MKKYLLLLIFLISPKFVNALSFNPNLIITDKDLLDCNTMTKEDIQSFLDIKGQLGKIKFPSIFEQNKTASEIIYNASKEFSINPKYLLVTLQKEQSLVESKNIKQENLDWATGYAVCDSCSKNDPSVLVYKGFENQVYNAARRNRYYIENPNQFSVKVGKSVTIDGIQITPQNQATANLYTYTPHLSGNQNFFSIWNKWFIKNYPDGTLLQEIGKPGVWLIQSGMRRPILTKSALISRFDPKSIITVSKTDIEKYEIGDPIKFSNYSILKNEKGSIYILINDVLRRISSWKVFKSIGFNPDEVINVKNDEIKGFLVGEDINEKSLYPTGAILKDKDTKEVWFVQDGNKYKITAKEVLDKYKGRAIITSNKQELEQFIDKGYDTLEEGTLLTPLNGGPIFIISNKEKRQIKSKQLFEELGFKWENVKKVSNEALETLPLGFPIEKTF